MFIGIQNYPALDKIKFTLSGVQLKTTKHAKKQENTTQNEGGKSINRTNPKMT